MKTIKIANSIAIGIPLLLFLLIPINEECLIFGMLSLILTGIAQTILALILWLKNIKNRFLIAYFAISILFFLSFLFIDNFNLDDIFSFRFWIVPGFLAVYLSVLIYQKKTLSEEKAIQ